jgi:hypothetical protein
MAKEKDINKNVKEHKVRYKTPADQELEDQNRPSTGTKGKSSLWWSWAGSGCSPGEHKNKRDQEKCADFM